MKYVITENRLENFFKNYLDSFLDSKIISDLGGNFIVVASKINDNDDTWEDFMEYDRSDGRLWINRDVLKSMNDIFNFDKEKIVKIIREWFENKFNVEIKYFES